MRHQHAGIASTAALLLVMAGCNDMGNNNTNLNTNANRAVVNENANVNANQSTGRAPTREEYEKNKQSYAEQAKEAGRTIGSGLDDGWIWVKTRFDLAAADDLRDSTINVDVDNNVVTLSGTVGSAEQKKRAEEVTKSVEGVKAVKNTLKVEAANMNHNANANMRHK
jgi:hyperosmotically inducible protein